ncbi:MAG: dihydrolipoamide acetyltransferase family protein [Phycisphaerales bacterium]
MSREFHLPDLGEGVHEGQILKILVAAGAPVAEDEPIMEVETDKAAVEIPSPYAGTIAAWHVEEKQVVNVGDLMVSFGPGVGESAPAAASDAASAAPVAAAASAASPAAASAHRPAAAAPATMPAASGEPRRRPPASPAVRSLARRSGVDLMTVPGSGPGGRILRRDVEAAAAGGPAPTSNGSAGAAASPATPLASPSPSFAAPMMAPPAAVLASAASASALQAPTAPAAPSAADLMRATAQIPSDAIREDGPHGPVHRAALSRTRLAIARVMTDAARSIPHVTDCDDADVTALNRFRKQHNAAVNGHERVGMLPFVIRAVARALQAFPIFNASWDEANQQVIYHEHVHIAIGVQTPRGLVAPVIRDANRKPVSLLAADLNAMTEKARAGRFEMADAAGATYTISNAGAMGGSRYATPIITPPQVAVLAVGMSREMPWVVDGQVVPRLIMPLSHSMDHRLIDGAVEIAFIRHLITDLEHPSRLVV